MPEKGHHETVKFIKIVFEIGFRHVIKEVSVQMNVLSIYLTCTNFLLKTLTLPSSLANIAVATSKRCQCRLLRPFCRIFQQEFFCTP